MKQWIISSFGQKRLTLLRILFGICFLGTIILVFYYSLQPAPESLEKSHAVTEIVNEVSFLSLTENVIRKIAHFCEYMVVGWWLMLLLNTYLDHFEQCLSWALFIGLLIPLTDETIQLFVPGRASLVADIWLDFAGVVCGAAIGYIAMHILIVVTKNRSLR